MNKKSCKCKCSKSSRKDRIKDIYSGKTGEILDSSGYSWKDVKWDDGTVERNVASGKLKPE